MSELETARGGEVRNVPPDWIRRNPENPRLRFDPEKMETLKDSIHSVGVLVPLIVYSGEEPNRYVLLDGERRWKCALELNLPAVPVNIIPTPTRLQNILRMFNIHNVREAWSITETAWKLQTVIDLLARELGRPPKEKEASVLTGLNPSAIRRCKKILFFPEKYQKMVHREEIKSDFLIEMYPVIYGMKAKVPDLYSQLSIEGIVDHFLKMNIQNVTDFRMVKKVLEADRRVGAPMSLIRKTMQRLFSEKDITFSKLYDESVKNLYDSFDIEKKIMYLVEVLEPLDLQTFENQPSLLDSFKRLATVIEQILSQVEEGQ